MLADLLRHHASKCDCDWAVCVSKKTARMTYLALHVIVHAVTSPQPL